MTISGLRIFFGFILGTAVNLGFFYLVMTANGTPVPSWREPKALLSYPMGSYWLTIGAAVFFYVFCLFTTAVLPPRKRTPRVKAAPPPSPSRDAPSSWDR